jgi:hypothetical protein
VALNRRALVLPSSTRVDVCVGKHIHAHRVVVVVVVVVCGYWISNLAASKRGNAHARAKDYRVRNNEGCLKTGGTNEESSSSSCRNSPVCTLLGRKRRK